MNCSDLSTAGGGILAAAGGDTDTTGVVSRSEPALEAGPYRAAKSDPIHRKICGE